MRYSQRCKWANTDCSENTECCSGACTLVHPGTDPRCATSGMRQPCLFHFDCDNQMKCGHNHRCCAGHWDTCSSDKDCCVPYHICRRMKGFVYRKCLPRPNTLMLPRGGNVPLAQNVFYLIYANVFANIVLAR